MSVPAHASRLAAVVALTLTLTSVAAMLVAAPAAARASASRAVLAFLPKGGDDNTVLDRLDARPQLALGLVSATQGHYTPQQALLDITQGSRTSIAVYRPRTTPRVELAPGGGAFIANWSRV